MRWVIENCPECGEVVHGTVEELQGLALVVRDGDDFEYDGYTDIWWDNQRTVQKDGKDLLMCRKGHEWFSERRKE